MYYLNNFFLYSLLGYLFETIIFFFFNKWKRSGFLFLWWTPFYGIGITITLLIYKLVSKKQIINC